MAAAESGPTRGDAFPYRMKDLVEMTGLPRQAIHFYIQQGLVPEGHKTGRNMAYYGDAHVERVKLVRQLQHERFLPLKAIRAIFEQRDSAFSASQRQLLADVKHRLAGTPLATRETAERVDATSLLERSGVSREELEQMVELGMLGASDDGDGRTMIAREDQWMVEMWGGLRALGFTPDLGFGPRDLAMYEEAVATLFRREAEMLTTRLAHLPPERVATMVERVLPLVNAFLVRYHATKIRNFFAAM